MTKRIDTRTEMRILVTGYLAAGNSLWDLLEMLIPDEDLKSQYDDILEVAAQMAQEDPSMTKQECLQYWYDTGRNIYENPTRILGG